MPVSSTKLLSASTSAALDRAAIEGGISGYELMSRAGANVVSVIENSYAMRPVLVLCGSGNNGGDGWVVAHLLRQKSWPVRACLVGDVSSIRGDAMFALKAWRESGAQLEEFSSALLAHAPLVVDAIFGIGLRRNVEGKIRACIEAINKAGLKTIAIDIPSGVDADTGGIMGAAVRADHTVTFTTAKPGHFLLPGKDYCGKVHVTDIGIAPPLLDAAEASAMLNDPVLWRELLPSSSSAQHKYHRGHAVVSGGGIECTGAAKLAAVSAQRSGAGLVSIACDRESLAVYAASLGSTMTKPCDGPDDFLNLIADDRVTAVIIGPGHGVGQRTTDFVTAALHTRKPCVLDADALTSFAKAPDELFGLLHSGCVLTPHEGEFSKLFPFSGGKCDRAQRAAETIGGTVVLKGSDTVIASPQNKMIINSNAPPSLATAGSGDVLAGCIGGLMAQGMPAFHAAGAGVWLHGAAASSLPAYGLIAEDILSALPSALLGAHRHDNAAS